MTKIKNYIVDSNPSINDKLIGTDVSRFNYTKNYRISDLADLIVSQGSLPSNINNSILVSGGVSWLENLTYDVSELSYYIDGNFYTTEPTQVTLEDADPTNARIDVIYATIDGNVAVHTGTPSPNPVRPRIFSSTQILVSFVVVSAGATTPEGVSSFLVYNEDVGLPGEFNTASSVSDGTIDFASTFFPYVGSVSTALKSVVDDEWLSFKTDSPYDVSDITTLSFQMSYMSVPDESATLVLSIWSGGSPVTNEVALKPGAFGVNGNITNEYQLIVIPFNDFTFESNEFDEIRIDVKGISDMTIFLDYIRLLSGINNAPLPGTYLALSDTDTSYSGKAGLFPRVRENETGMDLVSINGKKTFTATSNQIDFVFLSGEEFIPRMVFVNNTFIYDFTYNSTTLTTTLTDPVLQGSTVTIIE